MPAEEANKDLFCTREGGVGAKREREGRLKELEWGKVGKNGEKRKTKRKSRH